MLLVDDGQGQVFENHLVLNHGVRANHQRRLATGNQRQHLTSLFGLLTAGEPRGLDAQGLQPADELAKVLLSQNFGRCHQGALPPGIDANGGSQRGDHGFARAYVALEQPVHGYRPRNVVGNFAAHALLGSSQCKWQNSKQALVQRRLGNRREAGRTQQVARTFALQLRYLLRQQLLKLEPLPCRVAVIFQRGQRHIRRGMMQK